MHDVRRRGIEAVVERALDVVGEGPVFSRSTWTCSIPAFAPGTGTPSRAG